MKKKVRIIFHKKVESFILNLQERDRNKIFQVLTIVEERNLKVSSEWLKKVTENLWELRVKNFRFLGSIEDDIFTIWNGFTKKSMRIPKKEIELATKRMKEGIR
ncbi:MULTISPECIES: type II toxin-antitoxin system RelE/ParE family toxin [Thermodesulfovibrio]|jgi:mRNA-degrading endonuclease RelE of RelBE toxin-antitoxin system|uniref:type II toxin-antitoxin system RelE/ParE family toxin n=1 Tax=Thermodesulfovibrio TaxID=28261 RepID=UPI00262F470D|nr:type II toxin-antitoxin system RelE/ParE family toxin [Thermodesulfovibrio sp.]